MTENQHLAMYSCLLEVLLPGVKLPLVAFSIVEAEYIGASDTAKEAIRVRSLYARILYGKILYKHAEQCPHCLCSDYNSKATEPQQIFVDNQGAIQLAKNPKFHERMKHISVRFHFVRDACEWKAIKTTYHLTSDMLTDIMTKNLPQDTHWKHAHGLGLVSQDSGEVIDRPRVKRLKLVFSSSFFSYSFFGGCTLSPMSVVSVSKGFLHGYEF